MNELVYQVTVAMEKIEKWLNDFEKRIIKLEEIKNEPKK